MTVVVTQNKVDFTRSRKLVDCTIALSSTYATGGMSVTAGQFGLVELEKLLFENPNAGHITAGFEVSGATRLIKLTGGLIQRLAIPSARGGANTDIATDTTAVGSAPTNYNWISTTAAANNATAFTIAKQPDCPRNVSITIHATAGGVTTSARTYAIVGTYNGVAATDTISIPAVAMTNGNILVSYGVQPFDSITSITPSGAQPANTAHMAGIGTKFGLGVPTLNSLEADIKLIQKAAAAVTITSTYNATYNTVALGAVSDGDAILVKYMGKGNGGAELPNGTTVSATLRALAIGY